MFDVVVLVVPLPKLQTDVILDVPLIDDVEEERLVKFTVKGA